MTKVVAWTGAKCIDIFRHQLSIVSGEFLDCIWRNIKMTGAFGNNSSRNIGGGRGWLQTECILGDSKTDNAAQAIHIIRIM